MSLYFMVSPVPDSALALGLSSTRTRCHSTMEISKHRVITSNLNYTSNIMWEPIDVYVRTSCNRIIFLNLGINSCFEFLNSIQVYIFQHMFIIFLDCGNLYFRIYFTCFHITHSQQPLYSVFFSVALCFSMFPIYI